LQVALQQLRYSYHCSCLMSGPCRMWIAQSAINSLFGCFTCVVCGGLTHARCCSANKYGREVTGAQHHKWNKDYGMQSTALDKGAEPMPAVAVEHSGQWEAEAAINWRCQLVTLQPDADWHSAALPPAATCQRRQPQSVGCNSMPVPMATWPPDLTQLLTFSTTALHPSRHDCDSANLACHISNTLQPRFLIPAT
jgi:hypothetical protein